jgi:hypothetical protein
MPEQLPAHMPISAWNNPVSRGNHRQQTVSQGEPRVPLHLACSTFSVSWLSRLSLNIRAVSTRIVQSSLSADSHSFLPWLKPRGFQNLRLYENETIT